MKRVFGAKKDKEPPSSIQDASDRITKRGDNVEEKIKRLDAELARYREQIKKTRPGPAQEAIKARALRVLKQKRIYEGQRDVLYNQTIKLDQVSFAAEELKDAQQTMGALKSANKELKGMMKTVNIQDIDCYSELDALEADMGSETEGGCLLIFNLVRNLTRKESSTCHQPRVAVLQFLLRQQSYWLRMTSGYQLFLGHMSEVREGVGVVIGGRLLAQN